MILKNKHIGLVITLLCFAFVSHAQVFWFEDFGTGCNQLQAVNSFSGTNGLWSVMSTGQNAASANKWYVGATENGMPLGSCGDGCLNTGSLNDATLHVGNVSTSPAAALFCPTGDCGAAYDAGGFFGNTTTHTRAVSPTINLSTASSTVFIAFKYIEDGDAANDNFTLDYFDGATWSTINDPSKTATTCAAGQGLWTMFGPLSLPASAVGNSNVKLGFTWINNNDGIGNDPSAAIDSVVLFSIPPPPVASFNTAITTLCNGDCISYNNTSSGMITSWAWSFQGGTPSTSALQNPGLICYNTPGIYDVQLIVSNGIQSDTSFISQYITVNNCNPPIPNFNASQVNLCEGDCINFFDLSTNNPNQWDWTFTGSTTPTSTMQSPTSICYPLAGSYDVQLVAINQFGSDTLLMPGYINVVNCAVAPVASFNVSQSVICESQCITFTDASSNTPTSWTWSFPNGVPSTSNLQNPSVCYPVAGVYPVSLLVSNASGADSVTIAGFITVQVCQSPIAAFTPSDDSLCMGQCIVFADQSSFATSWNWDFPGAVPGTFVGQTPPSVCYNTIGNYTATLIVSNLFGADTTTFNITVDTCLIPQPIFSCSDSSICPGSCISFTDLSVNNPVGWFWSFPGGIPSNSSAKNPPFICYNSPGTYPVSLMVFNAIGADSITLNGFINVYPINNPIVNPSSSTIIIGNTVQLAASNGITYSWFPPDGLTDDSISNPIASPQTTTTYVITSVDANGCLFDTTAIVNVIPPNTVWAPNTFTPNNDSYNDVFQIYTTGAIDQFDLLIYDRWGNKVFETQDPQGAWDGTFNNLQMQGGVYIYYFKILFADGSKRAAKGDLLLWR